MRAKLKFSSKSRDHAVTIALVVGCAVLLASQYFVSGAKHNEPALNEAGDVVQNPAFVVSSIHQLLLATLIDRAESLEGEEVSTPDRLFENCVEKGGAEFVSSSEMDVTAAALAKRSALDAAMWLEEMPPSDARASALAALAVNWAGSSPEQAVTWAQTLPEDEGRELALMRAFGRWLEIDTEAAMHWLVDHESDPAADQMLGSFLRDTGFGLRQPHIAFRWAELISAPEQRGDHMEEIFRAWAFRNRDAATQYVVDSQQVNESERKRLLNSITKAVR
ncbi:MAG: hypothetical protein HZA32_20365 [Opitutae bacterium]|nr:hypothetical protein [Opitutae bacterium]